MLRSEERLSESHLQDVVIGQECAEKRHQLQVTYPLTNGVVTNWEDMARVWDHTFCERLCLDPPSCKVMLTEPPLNPKSNRRRMMETMFERYGFSGAFVQVQAVLALYAQGLLTGMVLDSGDGVSHVVPVVDGMVYPNLTRRLNIAGRHVTSHLVDLLLRRGYALNRTADFETVRQIKEELCYMAFDVKREQKLARETTCLMKSYTLPDGRVIKLGPERFMAPEALISPSSVDIEAPGIAEMVFNCIQEMDIDNRSTLYRHIVLSGGCTMFPGMSSRLEKELKSLYMGRVAQASATQCPLLTDLLLFIPCSPHNAVSE
ncbi:unnamed protein product [Ostreobium quekettii]|uniref:Actin-related protein 2 n=1 Tax=Ostreobium quekettii TaxID=121088 RepID=A0A8S1JGK8_9CHLO|nr:unnamed protein product [Ostreobium quekettii]